MSHHPEPAGTVWAHLNLRKLIPVIVGAGLGATVSHYKEQGELNWLPDWSFDVIVFVVLVLGVYWVWTQPDIQSAVRLAHNRRPKMLAVILIVVGMVIGGGVGLFGFWRIKRYQEAHSIYHFFSYYMPVAPNVPDHIFSFYPGPLSLCDLLPENPAKLK